MVISLSDFNQLSEQEKIETLKDLKNQIGVSGIVKAWEISRSKVYSLLNDLNIPLNPKGSKSSKSKSVSSADQKNISQNQPNPGLPDGADPKKNRKPKNLKKPFTHQSSLEFDLEESVAKFSLYLETQGNASLISDTVQMLLGADKLSHTNFRVNITLTEI